MYTETLCPYLVSTTRVTVPSSGPTCGTLVWKLDLGYTNRLLFPYQLLSVNPTPKLEGHNTDSGRQIRLQ